MWGNIYPYFKGPKPITKTNAKNNNPKHKVKLIKLIDKTYWLNWLTIRKVNKPKQTLRKKFKKISFGPSQGAINGQTDHFGNFWPKW